MKVKNEQIAECHLTKITTQVYPVKVRYTFDGTFYIKASNKAQAKEYAEKHCGLVIGGNIHSTLPDDDVNWDFSIHPKKTIR